MILIVSHSKDDHAAAVIGELQRMRHPTLLFDTARYPARLRLSQKLEAMRTEFHAVCDGERLDLGSCRVGWWRRPQAFALEPGMPNEAAAFAYSECHEAVAGLWHALDLTWVNPPHLDEVAHHKPYQLRVAAEVGLKVPRTLITNDPLEARQFVVQHGADRVVYKTFLASEACWRETRILRTKEVELLDHVRLAPVIFQEFVPAQADLRVTIIGERMFAAAIHSAPGSYSADYRMDMDGASFEPTSIPEDVQALLRNFMRRLGLVYGAVDLRRTPNGEHVFLEVNPAGEWRFVEERTAQPISRAMAEHLVSLDPPAEYDHAHETKAVGARRSVGIRRTPGRGARHAIPSN